MNYFYIIIGILAYAFIGALFSRLISNIDSELDKEDYCLYTVMWPVGIFLTVLLVIINVGNKLTDFLTKKEK